MPGGCERSLNVLRGSINDPARLTEIDAIGHQGRQVRHALPAEDLERVRDLGLCIHIPIGDSQTLLNRLSVFNNDWLSVKI